MTTKIVKLFFFLFLFMTFLAGGYFYTMNRAPYAYAYAYAESMQNNNEDSESTEISIPEIESPNFSEIATIDHLPVLPREGEVQDANRDDDVYNTNMYYGFDPTSQYVGMYTDIDKIHESTSFSELSDNPMDSNWGGVEYTRKQVDSGKYNDNLVVPYAQSNGYTVSTRIHKQPLSVFA